MKKNNKGNHQTCPICLSKCRNPVSPDQCSHLHCHSCLHQWTKIQNTCPVCKRRFHRIERAAVTKVSRAVERQKKMELEKNMQEEKIANRTQGDKEEREEEERIFGVLRGPQTRRNEVEFINLLFMLESIVQE